MLRRGCALLAAATIFALAAALPGPSGVDGPVPALAPGISPASQPTAATGSLGGISQSFALQPYLNGSRLQDDTLLQNLTIRFIGEDLYNASANFRHTVESTIDQIFANNGLALTYDYRPGVMVPVFGPTGLNGSRRAYAPTPGQVPAGFGRKLLQSQKPFSSETFANRFRVFMSIDVEIVARGGNGASLVQINRPSQLMGYLSVVMAQRSVQVQTTPINMSTTASILPITRHMPITVPYVLGTVVQVTGTMVAPTNTQAQTMFLLALLGLFGSQRVFLFNRIGAVWENSMPSQDLVRYGILTYTSSFISSMNEIAGGDVATLMTQVAQATGANFTVLVLSSEPLGTQADELAGSPRFDLDVSTPAELRARPSDGLSGGQVAGIVVGSVAGVIACVALLSLIGMSMMRRRQSKLKADDLEEMPSSHPLQKKSILNSGGADQSSGLVGSKGSTTGSSSNNIIPLPERLHPLSDAWNIHPAELAVCQLPDGRDWLLGTGSFGRVFRGLRGGVQDVAIKQIIKPGDMHLRMFEKEVALLRHLNFDKNLVQFYGACIADDNLMLVLEYMDGGDLKEALGNDPIGEFGWYGKGGSVLMDVARGLHFLHSNKVAHRDLKTKNILLSKAGEAKIGDVGLAKLVGSQLLSTQLDTAGTFAYAAPELLLGEPCDQSADIYSLGVIMWEVVTHEIPVRGALRAIDISREGPQEVADLIEKCLLRGPRARPTARDVFEALQALLAQPGASLPPVLESAERPSEDASDEATRIVPRGAPPTAVPSLDSRRTDSAASNWTEVHSGASSGPRPSPGASRKQIQSV